MEKITMFKAADGSLFDTEEKCKEYENNSKKCIIDRFKKLIVRKAEGTTLTKDGSAFPLTSIGERWGYAVIVMRNENDYETVKQYAELVKANGRDRIEKIFNEEIFVSIGNINNGDYKYDWFYWHCTVNEAIQKYQKALMTFNEED